MNLRFISVCGLDEMRRTRYNCSHLNEKNRNVGKRPVLVSAYQGGDYV
jgi:hypothetical protein